MRRWIAGALALFNMANGLVMLFASSSWWVSVPGVPETGPFNAHLSRMSARLSSPRAWRSPPGPGAPAIGRQPWLAPHSWWRTPSFIS